MSRPVGRTSRLLLRAGILLGISMVVVPFAMSAIGMAFASRVPGGLRGATHMPEMKEKVGFALGSSSLMAILAPPGILIAVSCGLGLAGERRKRPED